MEPTSKASGGMATARKNILWAFESRMTSPRISTSHRLYHGAGAVWKPALSNANARVLILGWIWACLAMAPVLGAEPLTRVLIDTERSELSVFQGDQVVLAIPDISIGRFGAAQYKRLGDSRTPIGRFRVAWIEPDSRFHLFVGLDYPTPLHAREALAQGVINAEQLWAIEQAFASGGTPPQDTPLGGYIGIHGIGDGDPEIHARYNWTRGCVALTNDQIDLLSAWIDIGTPVEIR
jgi:hypothetical protein